MNASKEEALKAQESLTKAETELDALVGAVFTNDDRNFIRHILLNANTFIDAARRKLPSEAAYAAEKTRKPKKAKAS